MKKIFYGLLLAFMVAVSGGVMSAYAMDYPSYLPTLPTGNEGQQWIVADCDLYNSGSGTFAFPLNPIFDFHGFKNGSMHGFYNDYSASNYAFSKFYKLVDGEWKSYSNRYFSDFSNFKFLYSDVDIYDVNQDAQTRTLVFPLPPVPLYQTVGEVTTEATAEEVASLGTVILTLTIIAVSCLALLIGLKLLPKVLSRFLHK